MFSYLLVVFQMQFLHFQCSQDVKPNVTICHNKNNSQSNRTMGKIIDVSLGSTINLECHFCNEPDDFRAKVWYFQNLGNAPSTEIIPNVNCELSEDCKFEISPSHTLHLKNFESNNSGIYFCKYFSEKTIIFIYVLDGLRKIKSLPKVGTYDDWIKFQRSVLDSTNRFIRSKKGSQCMSLDGCALFPFKMVFLWDNWGPCERFGNENLRKRIGKCRVRTMHSEIQNLISGKYTNVKSSAYSFNITSVSCRSIALNTFYPKLSRVIRNVPDFVMKAPCNLTQLSKKIENIKDENTLKCNITKHIAENGYLILTCPEIITEAQTDWYKDNIKLNTSFRNNMALSVNEPQLTIDAYNSLYILHATKADEGLYSCTVNGRNMQNFQVKVVTKAKLLNQDFIRYSIYLGFVLSLTVTCYCAGICVAWQRRASFADPLNLMKNKI